MAGFGGYSPFPIQFGGANATTLEAIRNALAQSYGTSLAVEKSTRLGAKIEAQSRILWDLYNACNRFSNSWNPEKLSLEMVQRWEGILAIIPSPYDTLPQRRNRIKAKLAFAVQQNTLGTVYEYLSLSLGPIFSGLDFISSADAVGWVPGGAVIPFGPTFGDGNTLGPNISPYNSNTGYIAILLQQPYGMSDEEFYSRAGTVYSTLDGAVGWWNTFDWILDGPNGPGFYLDEDKNLDNQRFD